MKTVDSVLIGCARLVPSPKAWLRAKLQVEAFEQPVSEAL